MNGALKIPRGAIWAATVYDVSARALEQLTSALMARLRAPATTDLDRAKTPEDVIAYAYKIRDREPSFADDLIAAAQRAQFSKD